MFNFVKSQTRADDGHKNNAFISPRKLDGFGRNLGKGDPVELSVESIQRFRLAGAGDFTYILRIVFITSSLRFSPTLLRTRESVSKWLVSKPTFEFFRFRTHFVFFQNSKNGVFGAYTLRVSATYIARIRFGPIGFIPSGAGHALKVSVCSGVVAVCNVVFRLTTFCSSTEIFAITSQSSVKSRRKLDIFGSPNFLGERPQISDPIL